ncbi:MAG: aldo/keto reductase [Bryobacterales bacterium]|nr:aldo/keto reductase [Bryobacterales bacterium]
MHHSTRRHFLKSAFATTALGAVGSRQAYGDTRSATDWVTLGNSGVKVTRLALGTGTNGGRIQREMGQEAFTRLVRHAYDRGIRFFETADAYTGMPQMLGAALKGIPRDSYRLMTKCRLDNSADPKATIDRFRTEMNSEYFDILLLHCIRTPNWVQDYKRLEDGLSEAKDRKIIHAHGASCHGLQPLRTFDSNNWLDVALLRINHTGMRMDTMSTRDVDELGDVKEVSAHIRNIRARGTGVIGMKLIGEGRFTRPEDRDAAMRYALKNVGVDSVTIGYKSTAEVDEAIDRIHRVLNS